MKRSERSAAIGQWNPKTGWWPVDWKPNGRIVSAISPPQKWNCAVASNNVPPWFSPGLMKGRVVIPIHDEGGRLVGYAGRSLDGSQPRYKFPGGFRKSQVLFNFHRAAATSCETVVVVEGFFDCLKVYQAGCENVVALMGTELYEHPARLLRERFAAGVALLLG